jgi:hypothetical protein
MVAARMPDQAFGAVPAPGLVALIEFTHRRDDDAALGGYIEQNQSLDDLLANGAPRRWVNLP